MSKRTNIFLNIMSITLGLIGMYKLLEPLITGVTPDILGAAIQFGIASMTFGGKQVGILQGVTIDFTFDIATLYDGAGTYPADVRVHTGNITGNAEFADIDAETFQKLLGGTLVGDTLTLTNSAVPSTFALVTTISTDGIPLTLTFPKCRSTKLSMAFARTDHSIPNFDFSVEANDAGVVATLDLGDIS